MIHVRLSSSFRKSAAFSAAVCGVIIPIPDWKGSLKYHILASWSSVNCIYTMIGSGGNVINSFIGWPPMHSETFRPVLSCPVLSSLILSCPVLSCAILSSLTPGLSRSVAPYSVLSYLALSRPVLSYPVLPSPVPSRPLPSRLGGCLSLFIPSPPPHPPTSAGVVYTTCQPLWRVCGANGGPTLHRREMSNGDGPAAWGPTAP